MKAKSAKSSTKNLRHNPMKFNKYRGDRGKKVQQEGESDEEVDMVDMEEMPDNIRRSVRFEDREYQSSRKGGTVVDSDEEVDEDEVNCTAQLSSSRFLNMFSLGRRSQSLLQWKSV